MRPMLVAGALIGDAVALIVLAAEPVMTDPALPAWLNTATAAVGLALLFWLIRMVARGDLIARSSVEAVVGHAIDQHKPELTIVIERAVRHGFEDRRRRDEP